MIPDHEDVGVGLLCLLYDPVDGLTAADGQGHGGQTLLFKNCLRTDLERHASSEREVGHQLQRLICRRAFHGYRLQACTDLPVPDPAHRLGTADLLARLSEERRTAFVLTQVLGLSYAEVADVEDVPVGTIRSRVARARDELVTAVAQARAV